MSAAAGDALKVIHCRACGTTEGLFLTAGTLYCLKDLPLEPLPVAQRITVLRLRTQAAREATQRRQEEREARR